MKNQALGFELGRKKHLLSQEELQLAPLAFVTCYRKRNCFFVSAVLAVCFFLVCLLFMLLLLLLLRWLLLPASCWGSNQNPPLSFAAVLLSSQLTCFILSLVLLLA